MDSRTYLRLNELIDIDDNWDGQGADSMSLFSLKKALEFLKDKKSNESLCVFFDYKGFIILEWFTGDLKVELTFNDNSNLYWNSFIGETIPLLDYHLSLLSFENILNIFNGEELEKLILISDIEDELDKKTIDSLISIVIDKDYDCNYLPSYAVDNETFINLTKFLDKFKIKGIYFWSIVDGKIEGHVKSEKYEIEFDFNKDIITIFKYPISDENTLEINVKDLDGIKDIEDLMIKI